LGLPCSAFWRAARFWRTRIIAISCSLTAVFICAIRTPVGLYRSICPWPVVASLTSRPSDVKNFRRSSSSDIMRQLRSWSHAAMASILPAVMSASSSFHLGLSSPLLALRLSSG
jgi:anti-sigma-K factor RskA